MRLVPALRLGTLASLLLLAPAGLRAQAVVDTTAAIEAASQAAESWMKLLDAGKMAQSWDEASTSFQGAVTSPQWVQSVLNARLAYEPFGERTRIAARYTTELPNAPAGQYVILRYRTKVLQDRTVVETVVPVLDGGRGWRVSGYFVRPE